MPIITNGTMTIEKRAEIIIDKVSKVTQQYDKVHLVAHSFAGIDARCAISMMDFHTKVHSLTTLCSPHHGCGIITKATKFPQITEDVSHTEKAIEACGLSMLNA